MSKVVMLKDEEDQDALPVLLAKLKESLSNADWDFLESELPQALSQSQEGLQRIQTIVSAMKEFSHPSGETAEPGDLNSAIRSTVTVAENKWKYIANMELDLETSLPLMPCFLDQFNQVILNMIINSVHAIEEMRSESDEGKGNITIRTRHLNSSVELAVTDSGIGMDDTVKTKVFDSFFTTKEVGKGTGQGLAIAGDIIRNKHHGEIEVISAVGKGSTFIIRLPMKP
jgi:signal transduction histidine kinase